MDVADTAETSAAAVPYHLDTPLFFVSWHPCVWHVGHGRGEANINKRSTDNKRGEQQVAIIPLTIGLLSDGR